MPDQIGHVRMRLIKNCRTCGRTSPAHLIARYGATPPMDSSTPRYSPRTPSCRTVSTTHARMVG